MGRWRSRGLRLQRISQNWLCSRSFLSIYNLSQPRRRRAIASVCTALRAQTLAAHVTPSITMEASFCCCWLQGFPPGYHRPGEPPGLIYLPTWPGHWKIKLQSIQDYNPGLCWLDPFIMGGKILRIGSDFFTWLRVQCLTHSFAMNPPAYTYYVQFYWHLATSPVTQCAASPHTDVHVDLRQGSLNQYFSTVWNNDWGSPGNLAPALKSKH